MGCSFEVVVRVGREAEAFNTALYRFAELRMDPSDGSMVSICTEPMGPVERKRVTLWSPHAVADFEAFWKAYATRARPDAAPVF